MPIKFCTDHVQTQESYAARTQEDQPRRKICRATSRPSIWLKKNFYNSMKSLVKPSWKRWQWKKGSFSSSFEKRGYTPYTAQARLIQSINITVNMIQVDPPQNSTKSFITSHIRSGERPLNLCRFYSALATSHSPPHPMTSYAFLGLLRTS